MKSLIPLILSLLAVSTAEAQVSSGGVSNGAVIPPTIGAQTILCNNTTAVAAPIACTFAALSNISAPTTPASGAQLYVDTNGAFHVQSQWYDATLPGGKYTGDATRPWFTTGIGFGLTVTGAGNNQPNIRIQKANSSALAAAALSLLDTIGTNTTAQETSVIFNTLCSAGAGYDGIACVGMQVEADKTSTNSHGNPFAANFVAKDLTGSATSQVAIESDVVASNPDTSLVRVINDNICREGIAQSSGQTTCAYGIRSRPSDNAGATTGPVKLLTAYQAYTQQSYPGASIGDAFASDGGATNGVSLSSKVINTTTNALGTSGTNTLTFALAGLAAASPGSLISDGGEAFIPANTTITGVSTTGGVTTITMSANQTGNVANGQAITITQAYGTGILENGRFSTAARSVTTQFGLEETLQNGDVLGAATGGAQGVGTLNATNLYINGASLLTGPISKGTKFTATGTGACATITTTLGGAQAGSFLCTGTAGASTATITINGATGLTAPTGWACSASDATSGVAWAISGAASTTTATISGAIATTSDRVVFNCMGY